MLHLYDQPQNKTIFHGRIRQVFHRYRLGKGQRADFQDFTNAQRTVHLLLAGPLGKGEGPAFGRAGLSIGLYSKARSKAPAYRGDRAVEGSRKLKVGLVGRIARGEPKDPLFTVHFHSEPTDVNLESWPWRASS